MTLITQTIKLQSWANEAKINGKDYLNMSSDERQNFYEKGKEYQDNFNRSVSQQKK